MTDDPLRDAIARDCPHRLVDYDQHLAGRQSTAAFIQLWREEHAISSHAAVEARLDRLYRQAQTTSDYATAKDYLEQASRIRHEIREGLK